jgi:hypothetical protein
MTGTSSADLIKAEVEEFVTFIDGLVTALGVEVTTLEEAHQVVAFAAELYVMAKAIRLYGRPTGGTTGASGQGQPASRPTNGGK